jgi:hypothetical protein
MSSLLNEIENHKLGFLWEIALTVLKAFKKYFDFLKALCVSFFKNLRAFDEFSKTFLNLNKFSRSKN